MKAPTKEGMDYGFALEGTGGIRIAHNKAYEFGTGPFSLTALVQTLRPGVIFTSSHAEGWPGSGGFALLLEENGQLRFRVHGHTGGAFWQRTSEPTGALDGEWHHFAAIRREQSTLEIYFDGKLLKAVPLTSAGPLPTKMSGLLIGTSDDMSVRDRQLFGIVEDVTLWNRAISEDDLIRSACNNLTGGEAGLVGLWDMNGRSATVVDRSGTGNPGQATGDYKFVPIFHAIWFKGRNGYSHCGVTSSPASAARLRELRNGADRQAAPPVGEGYHAIVATSGGQLVRAILGSWGDNPDLTMGSLNPNTGEVTADMRRGRYGVLMKVGRAGTEYPSTSIVIASSTGKLDTWSFPTVDGIEAEALDVWTATGWEPVQGPGGALGRAVTVEGLYYYRVVALFAKLDGAKGLIANAAGPFTLKFYRGELVNRAQSIEVPAGAPFLHATVITALDDASFPPFANVEVFDPNRRLFNVQRSDKDVTVIRRGRSLHALFVRNPQPGRWMLVVNAQQETVFHAQLDTLPAADIPATYKAELSVRYPGARLAGMWLSRAPSDSLADVCGVCVVAGVTTIYAAQAAVLGIGLGAMFAGGPAATAIAMLAAASAYQVMGILFRTLGFPPERLAEAVCHRIGLCESSPFDLDRIINQSSRYDQVCFLTAHNAFSYKKRYKPSYTQQNDDLGSQFDMGVSAFMLDTWTFQPSGGDKDIYLCHEGCTVNSILEPFSSPQTLQAGLEMLVGRLNANKDRVVTIIFETKVGPGVQDLVDRAFERSGAKKLVFWANRDNQGTSGDTWNVGRQGWPTIKWMVDNNLRLVVFGSNEQQDGFPKVWDYAVESVYGDKSENPAITDKRAESQPLDTLSLKLFILNRFPDWTIWALVPEARYLHWNRYALMKNQVDRYTALALRPPNFLAVDYFELGREGGPRRCLGDINQMWDKLQEQASPG